MSLAYGCILRSIFEDAEGDVAATNKQLDELTPRFQQACADVTGLRELSGRRAKVRVAMRAAAKPLSDPAAVFL